MELRQRKGKKGESKTLDRIVQDLDAFQKISDDSFVEKTASGAFVSIITAILVLLLLWGEMDYFFNPGFTFRFIPDSDFESKLNINVDLTIATPCKAIGADIIDQTNQNAFKFGALKEEDTWFELDRIQRQHFNSIRLLNQYLKEEYHAIQNLLWKSSSTSLLYGDIPPRRTIPDEPHDACRIYGSLTLNKVAGNFHISPGKALPLIRGHAHLSIFNAVEDDFNFTHRIDKFSFGSPHGGIVQPLEGEEKTSNDSQGQYQYFIQIVPTDIQGYSDSLLSTYQYSVKEHFRPSSSRGTPGIYFKYDFSALKVLAKQDRQPITQFIVRLCSSVGGLIATSHIICNLIKALVERYFCGDKFQT